MDTTFRSELFPNEMIRGLMLSLLVVLAGASAKAETWYLFTTIHSGVSQGTTRPVVVEMDSREGCEEAGNLLKEEVKTNRIERVRTLSFACIKRK